MFDGIKKTIDELFTPSEWKFFAERDFIERCKMFQNLSKEEWNNYEPTVENAILSQCPDYRLLKWIKPQWDVYNPSTLQFVFRSITDTNIDPHDVHSLCLEIENGQGNFKCIHSIGYDCENSKCVFGLSIQDAASLFFERLPAIFVLKNDDFYREIKPCRNAFCLRCQYVDYDKRKNELQCAAFYKIPQEIISGEYSHYQSLKEQTYDCTFQTEIPPVLAGPPVNPCEITKVKEICCKKCMHYDNNSNCCPAFPEGVPLIVKLYGHKQVFPGQNVLKISFERKNKKDKK